MLEILGAIFGSIFSGGATGLIGIAVQRYADYKNRQQNIEIERMRLDNEIKLREMDARIMAQEWAARTKVAEVEAAGREAVADSEAFAVSLKSEPMRYAEGVRLSKAQRWIMVFLDFLRGIVRPGLTLYLCALTTMIYIQARELLSQEDLTSSEALEIERLIISTILYLTTTCILWHFGTRNKQAPPKV